MFTCAGTETAIALCRQEFEDLVIRQVEAYTEKPADVHDLRNACRHAPLPSHVMSLHTVSVFSTFFPFFLYFSLSFFCSLSLFVFFFFSVFLSVFLPILCDFLYFPFFLFLRTGKAGLHAMTWGTAAAESPHPHRDPQSH